MMPVMTIDRACMWPSSASFDVFMGLSFAGLLRNLQFKAAGNPTLFSTHRRQPGPARSFGVCLPGTCDAFATVRSGLSDRWAVGGFFHVQKILRSLATQCRANELRGVA